MQLSRSNSVGSVLELLRDRVAEQPDAEYVKCGGDWLTFDEIDQISNRVASGLSDLRVHPGDRVAVLLSNRQEGIEIFFALLKIGAIQIPLNPFLRGDFLEHQLSDASPRVLITDRQGIEIASPLLARTDVDRVVVVDGAGSCRMDGIQVIDYGSIRASQSPIEAMNPTPAQLVSIVYTSGTTGPSKGCMLSNGYYTSTPGPWEENGWIAPHDRIFTAMPLYHFGGHMALMFALAIEGGSVCIEPEFSASSFMSRAAEEDATQLFGIGSMGMAILKQHAQAHHYPKFRLACFPPMHPESQAQLQDRFGTPVIAEGLGQTECNMILLDDVSGPRRPGKNGRACSTVEVRIVDESDNALGRGEVGELVIRPRRPYVTFSGYWNRPEATAEAWRNLWHHTGDLFRDEGDGFYTFIDRKKDMIRRHGENVSSFEVETAILQHPAVSQVAVCAVAGDLGSEEIKVSLVPASENIPTPAEMFDFFRTRLPYYAIPRYFEIRSALPVSATGRVRKDVLRDEGLTPSTVDLAVQGLRLAKSERRSANVQAT